LQTHAHRELAHVLLARGDWQGLCDLAITTQRLVAQHPETSFCYAITVVLSFASVAHVLSGRKPNARAPLSRAESQAHVLLSRAELPLQAEPLERESVLLLAYGTLGERHKFDQLRREVLAQVSQPFWYFRRMEAVVLTMLERWDALPEVLPPLEQVARKGSPYIEALLAAIREERAAAEGGPKPRHAMLRGLGYAGWSQLLAHRPLAVRA